MSYMIQYEPELKKRYPERLFSVKNRLVFRIFLLVALVVAVYFMIQENVFQVFIFGEPDVTAAAFDELREQVHAGKSIREAVMCFFRSVVANGVSR